MEQEMVRINSTASRPGDGPVLTGSSDNYNVMSALSTRNAMDLEWCYASGCDRTSIILMVIPGGKKKMYHILNLNRILSMPHRHESNTAIQHLEENRWEICIELVQHHHLEDEWSYAANNCAHRASDSDPEAVSQDRMSGFVLRSKFCSFHNH